MSDSDNNKIINTLDKITIAIPYILGISVLAFAISILIYFYIHNIDIKIIQKEIINRFAYILLFVAIISLALRYNFLIIIVELCRLWKKSFFAENEDKSEFISLFLNKTKFFTYMLLFSLIGKAVYEIFIKS